MSMQFTDICFITRDVLRLCAFYEAVLGGKAEGDEVHSGLSQAGINFTFMLEKTPAFYFEMGSGASNTILSFGQPTPKNGLSARIGGKQVERY